MFVFGLGLDTMWQPPPPCGGPPSAAATGMTTATPASVEAIEIVVISFLLISSPSCSTVLRAGARDAHLHERLKRADPLAGADNRTHCPMRVTRVERPAFEHETGDSRVPEEGNARDAEL